MGFIAHQHAVRTESAILFWQFRPSVRLSVQCHVSRSMRKGASGEAHRSYKISRKPLTG